VRFEGLQILGRAFARNLLDGYAAANSLLKQFLQKKYRKIGMKNMVIPLLRLPRLLYMEKAANTIGSRIGFILV